MKPKHFFTLLLTGLILLSCTESTEPERKVSAPKFNPSGGTRHNPIDVVIYSDTAGALIKYTTDGTDPDQSSTTYTTPIEVTKNTTIKAKAFKEGMEDSRTSTAEYNLQIAELVFNPPGGEYIEPQEVQITCETEGVYITYTLDGSEPDEYSTQYIEPIFIATDITIKARAFKWNWEDGNITTADYRILDELTVSLPVFEPAGGIYKTPQLITIKCDTEGAIIRYTTDGNDPTEESELYTGPIVIASNTTIKARGFKLGWKPSQIIWSDYAIEVPVGELVFVEGGTFSPDGGSFNVILSSFYISNTEVTQFEWTLVMGDWDSDPHGRGSAGIGDNNPIYYVSWFDAVEYCNRLSIREGLTPTYSYANHGTNPANWPVGWNEDNDNHTNVSCNWNANGYRLPTEMEWEFAARGGVPAQNAGTFNDRWAGTDIEAELVNFAWYIANSNSRTHHVGTKLPNELGLYDMSGNVWNWVWDIWYYYPYGVDDNPTGPITGYTRVLRGGSWNDLRRVDDRYSLGSPAVLTRSFGFRVARSIN